MREPISRYWERRMERVKGALEANNFEVFISQHQDEARALLMETILPATGARSASWGGSMTAFDAGIYDALLGRKGLEVIHTSEKNISVDEMLERRRRALLVDLLDHESPHLVNWAGDALGKFDNPDVLTAMVAASRRIGGQPMIDAAIEHLRDLA